MPPIDSGTAPPSIVNVTSGSFTGSAATLAIPATSNTLVAILSSDVELTASVSSDGIPFRRWSVARTSCGHYAEIDIRDASSATADQVITTLTAPATFTIDVIEISGVSNLYEVAELVSEGPIAFSPELDYLTNEIGLVSVATCGALTGLVQPTRWTLLRPNIAAFIAPAAGTGSTGWTLPTNAESDTIAVRFPTLH